MRNTARKILTNVKALTNYAIQGGDYGVRQNLKVSTKDRIKVMRFFHDSPLNVARKTFKLLYKHYTK